MGSEENEVPFLKEIYVPQAPFPHIDVVFVHGLNVHDEPNFAKETWTENDVFWPKDLLPEDFPEARILLFGYNSNVSTDVSEARIKEHADMLLWKLKYKRKLQGRILQTKLILVGHNLGGIIIKTALLRARENAVYKQLLGCMWGLVFFACPHKGADGKAFGDIVAQVAKSVSLGRADNDLLHGLQRNSFFTEETIDRFSQQLEHYQIVSIYETQPMYLGGTGDNVRSGLVVPTSSAILGLPGKRETRLPFNKNHVDICRVSGRNEMYKDIWAAFDDLIDGALRDFDEREAFVASERKLRLRSRSVSPLPNGPVSSSTLSPSSLGHRKAKSSETVNKDGLEQAAKPHFINDDERSQSEPVHGLSSGTVPKIAINSTSASKEVKSAGSTSHNLAESFLLKKSPSDYSEHEMAILKQMVSGEHLAILLENMGKRRSTTKRNSDSSDIKKLTKEDTEQITYSNSESKPTEETKANSTRSVSTLDLKVEPSDSQKAALSDDTAKGKAQASDEKSVPVMSPAVAKFLRPDRKPYDFTSFARTSDDKRSATSRMTDRTSKRKNTSVNMSKTDNDYKAQPVGWAGLSYSDYLFNYASPSPATNGDATDIPVVVKTAGVKKGAGLANKRAARRQPFSADNASSNVSTEKSTSENASETSTANRRTMVSNETLETDAKTAASKTDTKTTTSTTETKTAKSGSGEAAISPEKLVFKSKPFSFKTSNLDPLYSVKLQELSDDKTSPAPKSISKTTLSYSSLNTFGLDSIINSTKPAATSVPKAKAASSTLHSATSTTKPATLNLTANTISFKTSGLGSVGNSKSDASTAKSAVSSSTPKGFFHALSQKRQKALDEAPFHVKANYDFKAQQIGDLTFNKGDIIMDISNRSDKGWWVGTLNGTTGSFPHNYTERVLEYASANCAHISTSDKELSFQKGDLILVVSGSRYGEAWRGCLGGVIGSFPSQHCKILPLVTESEHKNRTPASIALIPETKVPPPAKALESPVPPLVTMKLPECSQPHPPGFVPSPSRIQCTTCWQRHHCRDCSIQLTQADTKKSHYVHEKVAEQWAHYRHFYTEADVPENVSKPCPYTLIPMNLLLGRSLADWVGASKQSVQSNLMHFDVFSEGSTRLVIGGIPKGTWHPSFQIQHAPASSFGKEVVGSMSLLTKMAYKTTLKNIGSVTIECVEVIDRKKFLTRTGGLKSAAHWSNSTPVDVGNSNRVSLVPVWDPVPISEGSELGVLLSWKLNTSSFKNQSLAIQQALGFRWRLEAVKLDMFAYPQRGQAISVWSVTGTGFEGMRYPWT